MVAKHHGISSHREYLQLSGPFVWSTNSSPEHFQLSKVPTVVESTSSCREHLHLSRAPPVVQSTSICPKYLHLSTAPPVVQSTSSCREHHQSEVSPLARSTSSCPKCLQLSRGPSIVGSISVCREQLSGVPRVVEGTSISRKYLHQPGARAVVQSTSTCREHLQLSKVLSVLESDICQTGSAIQTYRNLNNNCCTDRSRPQSQKQRFPD